MSKILTLIKNQWLSIVFAFFVGMLLVLPQLFFIYQLGDQYQGIYMLKADAETHYLARMQEAIDGHYLSNPFLFEYKDGWPTSLYSLSEIILAYPSKIFDIKVTDLNLFYKFFLPLIIFLLIYSLFFRLTKSRGWALATALVIILGDNLFNFSELINIIRNNNEIFSQFAMYARPINPQISSILFFSYLHLLLTALQKEKLKWFFLLALVFGLSFYIYFFSWTFLFALNLTLAIIYLWQKNKKIFYKLLLATVVGFSMGLLAIINLLKLFNHQYYSILINIYRSSVDHFQPTFIIFSRLGLLIFLSFLIYYIFSKKTKIHYLLLSLLITSFIVINYGVILRIQLQHGHYHWYFNTPIYLLVIFWLIHNLSLKIGRKILTIFLIMLVLLAVAKNIFIQKSSYNNNYYLVASQQDYAKIFSWLNNHTQKDSVVLANNQFSELIPIYSHNNVYWNMYAGFYLLPLERIESALFLYLKLNKVLPIDFNKENFNNLNLKLGSAFPRLDSGIYDDKIFEKYQNFWQDDLNKNFAKYRLDYIVWDTNVNPEWQLDKYDNLKLVNQYNNILIYQVNN